MIINNPTMSTNAVIIKTTSLPMLISNGGRFAMVETTYASLRNANSTTHSPFPMRPAAPHDRRRRPLR